MVTHRRTPTERWLGISSQRENLARRIAFLETDISAVTADAEAGRMTQLERAWAEYGPSDDFVQGAIQRRARQVEQEQRDGEYDA